MRMILHSGGETRPSQVTQAPIDYFGGNRSFIVFSVNEVTLPTIALPTLCRGPGINNEFITMHSSKHEGAARVRTPWSAPQPSTVEKVLNVRHENIKVKPSHAS
jgi:hypothetical protein